MSIRDLIPWRHGEEAEGRRTLSQPFAELHREMDRAFEDFFKGFGMTPFGERAGEGRLVPRVDVSETDEEVQVTVDLPGLEEKDIEVTLSNGVLSIKGEKKAEKEEKKKEYHRIERSYGMYQRSISLPSEVDEGKVDAKFAKGVLTVTLPKSEKAKARTKKIEVRSGKA